MASTTPPVNHFMAGEMRGGEQGEGRGGTREER